MTEYAIVIAILLGIFVWFGVQLDSSSRARGQAGVDAAAEGTGLACVGSLGIDACK